MRVAIIPARGGSKRIPHKNIKEFNGKPIIAYSIECAKESGLFDKIIVSTDDIKVKDVAERYGAEVWIRSKENSNDFATITDVIIEVLEQSQKRDEKFKEFALIYATAPLILSSDMKESYKLLGKSDVVLPVAEFTFPILRSLVKDDKGYLKFQWRNFKNTRSQDLPKSFHDTGTFFGPQLIIY